MPTDTFPDAHKPSLLPSREEGNTFLVQIRVELGGLDDSVCVPVDLREPSGSAGAGGEPPAVALDVARGLLHADAQVAVEVDVREVPRSLKGILPFGKWKNDVNITYRLSPKEWAPGWRISFLLLPTTSPRPCLQTFCDHCTYRVTHQDG